MKGTALALCVILAFILVTQEVFALELSADMVVKEGGETYSSKVYIKGEKFRVDVEGREGYTVFRQDADVMWMMIPEEKTYLEMPLDPGQRPRLEERLPGEVSRRLLGSEEVNGHPAEKYEVTVSEGGKTERLYQWVARDLGGLPIKNEAVDGSWSAEYRNIETSVPDSLFEVPPGFEKLSMPGMQGGMRGR